MSWGDAVFGKTRLIFFSIDPRRSGFERMRIKIIFAKNRSKSGQKHLFWLQNLPHQFRSCVQISPPINSLKLNKMDTKKLNVFVGGVLFVVGRCGFRQKASNFFSIDPRRSGFERMRIKIIFAKNRSKKWPKTYILGPRRCTPV